MVDRSRSGFTAACAVLVVLVMVSGGQADPPSTQSVAPPGRAGNLDDRRVGLADAMRPVGRVLRGAEGARAPPPPGHGGQLLQVGLAHVNDVGMWTPSEDRYGPNAPSGGFAQGVDPDDPDLRCMECVADGTVGFDSFNGMEQITEQLAHAQYRDDVLDDVVVMFEVRVGGNGYAEGPGIGNSKFFQLRTVSAYGFSETGLSLGHARTGSTYRGRVWTITGGAQLTGSWLNDDRVTAEQWSTILLRYRASTDPGNLADGRVDVWVADCRMADLEGEVDFRQVVAARPHDSGAVRKYQMGASSSQAGMAPVAHHFTRYCRGIWQGDLESTIHAAKYRNFGVEVGVDLPSNLAGKRDVMVAYRHDRALLGTGAADGIGIVQLRFEHSTDPGFPDSSLTDHTILVEADDWQDTHQLVGLDADRAHFVRAVITLDAGGPGERTITTETCTFRTLTSAANGKIKFVVGACSLNAPSRTPARPFETIESHERDLNFIAHLGDQNYHDRKLIARYGEAYEELATRQDAEDLHAMMMCDYAQSLAATVSPFWRQWDDHELRDGWSGATAHPLFFPIARSAFRTYSEQNRPSPASPYYGPTPGPGDLETAPGMNDGRSPDGLPWAEDDVHYWYTESASVLFVMLDTRTTRSTALGTMLGRTQLQWLEDLISNTDKHTICLFSSVRWTDGNENKGDDFWGWNSYNSGYFTAERTQIIEHFRSVWGESGFLLLLSGDDHLSSGTRNFGLGGYANVYELESGGFCTTAHSPSHFPDWLSRPEDYEWLTNNDLDHGPPADTIRIYSVVEIDESSGVIELTVKDGNTGFRIAGTTLTRTLGPWSDLGRFPPPPLHPPPPLDDEP